jgi:drug/metabolite transporter (DMT)-like permease
MSASVGLALAILAALGLAGQALTVRFATRRNRSSDVLLVALVINAAVFVALAVALTADPVLTPTSLLAFVAAGIIPLMLGRAFYYAGIERIGASRAEPIKASMPLFATVLAFFVLGETVTGLQFGGIVLVVLGIALLSWESSGANGTDGEGTPWVGVSLPLVGAFLLGTDPIFAVIGFREQTPVLVGLAIKTVSATVAWAGYVTWRDSVPLRNLDWDDRWWFLLVGLTSSGFLLAYYAGIAVSRVGLVVPIMQTSPLIVLAISAAFLRDVERVTPRLVVAASIVVVGAVGVTVGGV